MASTVLTRSLLTHRFIHSSFSLSTHKPRLLSSLFNKRQFHFQSSPSYTAYKASSRVPCVMVSSVVGRRANFSTQTLSTNEPVVSVDWLHANLKEPDLKVPAWACSYCPSFLAFG
uniref:Uncharacterized protein n=1 Tax=Quercus lobata TaxID=97700 RepID=A0A7N2LIE0_QUELO